MNGVSKYAPLAHQLAASHAEVIEMTFAEVDELVLGGLPKSAYQYRTWWTGSGGSSAQSRHGWIRAGYRVSRVDLTEHRVTFTTVAIHRAAHLPVHQYPLTLGVVPTERRC